MVERLLRCFLTTPEAKLGNRSESGTLAMIAIQVIG
jgi:hypothetical protein